MAKIELSILNPEQFQTLQKMRDFFTGNGAVAMYYAISEALAPATDTREIDRVEGELKAELADARQAAIFLVEDLVALAKCAIESEGDPEVSINTAVILDKERRALLLISLWSGDVVAYLKREIIGYLGGGDRELPSESA